MSAQRSFYVLVAMAALACGSDPKPPPVAPMPVVEAPPPPPPPPEPPPQKPGDDPRQSVINVSDEIMVACGITEAEAKFGYDSAKVQKGDQPVLNKLVACFTTGKLSGRTMRLVGHADPRGEAGIQEAAAQQVVAEQHRGIVRILVAQIEPHAGNEGRIRLVRRLDRLVDRRG